MLYFYFCGLWLTYLRFSDLDLYQDIQLAYISIIECRITLLRNYLQACACVIYREKMNTYPFPPNSFSSPYPSTLQDVISICVSVCQCVSFKKSEEHLPSRGWERLAQVTTLGESLDNLCLRSIKGSRFLERWESIDIMRLRITEVCV